MDRTETEPLRSLDEWEDDLERRYPAGSSRAENTFRNYEETTRPTVREFYRLNHQHQTLDFVLAKKQQYVGAQRRRMTIWEAMEYLNTLVDDSDPDTDLSQIEHLVQSAEAARADGRPDWFVLTCLIHDLGKILCFENEPQWAVVGDTFPVGCRFDESIVFHNFFEANPDLANPRYSTKLGIYEEGCGLKNVHMSWGHDEYMYHVVKHRLPAEALAMIRYHSFYPWHREGAYDYLMDEEDRKLLRWVQEFNPYDLYSKGREKPDVEALKPYYTALIEKYFPEPLWW